jgi:hypothetical protein
LFDAAYIKTGIIDPNRLGTGATGAGNLYLADDGTWKTISVGGGGDMLRATYDVDNDGVVDSAERTEIIVRNSTGTTLTKGTVVYLSGATGNRPNALRAQAHTEATSSKTIGMVEADIPNNSDGYVATNGTLHNLDTSAFTAGDAVWLSATTAGGITTTVPAEPNHAVFVGYIARSHPTQGRIVLHIQNGYELNELHGVLVTSEANNDLLVYESSTALWKNKTFSAIFGGTPLVSVPTLAQVTTAGNTTTNAITVGNITVNSSTNEVKIFDVSGGNYTRIKDRQISFSRNSGSSESVSIWSPDNQLWMSARSGIFMLSGSNPGETYFFARDYSGINRFRVQDTGNVIIQESNNNVLIGTTTDAGYKLDVNGSTRVKGAGTTSATTAFLVQNSTPANLFTISDDGSAVFDLITSTSGVVIRRAGTPTSRLIQLMANGGARFYTFDGEAAPNANGDDGAWFFKGRHRRAANSGIASAFRIEPFFAQEQFDTIQLNSIHIVPTINVTGTATNVTVRGIYYNPTVSSLTGVVAHRAIETTSGDVIFNGGNVGIGTTTPTYKVDVQGTALSTSSVRVQGAFDVNPLAAPSAIGGFTLSAGTNLGVGQYYYFVVYVTALGETSAGATLLVTTTTGNTTVNLTGIPVSTDPRVTARKIYRTLLNQTSDAQRFLATISDNVTTTYTDSATDASLTGVALQYYKVNTTARYFTVSGVQGMVVDQNLTALGRNAGAAIISSSGAAIRTVLIGAQAGQNITTGQANVIVGVAGSSLTTGSNNTLVGDVAGWALNSGYENTFLGGDGVGRFVTTGYRNTFIGNQAGRNLNDGTSQFTVGFENIAIGNRARMFANNDSNSIVIGNNALGLGSNTTVIGNSSTTFTSIPAGNFGINTTTNAGYRLDVVGSARITNAAAQLIVDNATYSELNYGSANYFRANGSSAVINGPNILFLRSGTEVARFASTTGNLLVASNVDAGYKFDVSGTAKFRSATYFGQISQPLAPILNTNSTTGGTLPADTYTYRISALDFWNVETTPSNTLVVTTTGSTSSVSISWLLVQGAYSYRIYRLNSAGTLVYFTNFGTNITSFTDTGTAGTVGVTAAVNHSSYGWFNNNGDFRSGNITIVNNGVGNTSSIIFDKSTDGPQINVVEYANDATLFEFALRDNPDGPDAFHFVMPDWQNPSSGWKPFKFAAFNTQIVGQTTNFWSSFSLPSSTPYYTTNPESVANSQIKWDPYTSTSYNLPKDNGTGTGVFNVDITGFTGTNNTIYWVTIQPGATTFNWGIGWSGGTPSASGVAITGGWQTIGNGVQVRITGAVAANDRWAFRAFPVPRMGIGTTTPIAPLQVSTTVTPTSATARGVFFNPTLVASANNDTLIGLDIAPTYTNGAFTGVTNVALRVASTTSIVRIDSSVVGSFHGIEFSNSGNIDTEIKQRPSTGEFRISNGRFAGWGGFITLYTDTAERMRIRNNGNVLIGATADAGYKLDVNGTARVQGAFTATLANVSTANVVYYNSSTGLMTYATAPIGAQFVIDYDYNIVGLKNGSNVLFTTSATFIVNTTRVFLNGQRLTRGAGYDYIETGTNQITFTNPPVSTDLIIIEYQI